MASTEIVADELLQGLEIAPESRCSPYNSKEYHYSQFVEKKIVQSIGKIYGPYTGRCFDSMRETDIEHIVARSEAHDSGLCAASDSVRREFASDLLNLTLASPSVNRHQKVARDAAEWVPNLNECWFAERVIAVKRKYTLTVDKREAEALSSILSQCESTEMIVLPCDQVQLESPPDVSSQSSPGSTDPLDLWDDNGNGRITCAEARRHRIAPVFRDHPAYKYMQDGDGDGVVCE